MFFIFHWLSPDPQHKSDPESHAEGERGSRILLLYFIISFHFICSRIYAIPFPKSLCGRRWSCLKSLHTRVLPRGSLGFKAKTQEVSFIGTLSKWTPGCQPFRWILSSTTKCYSLGFSLLLGKVRELVSLCTPLWLCQAVGYLFITHRAVTRTPAVDCFLHLQSHCPRQSDQCR